MLESGASIWQHLEIKKNKTNKTLNNIQFSLNVSYVLFKFGQKAQMPPYCAFFLIIY